MPISNKNLMIYFGLAFEAVVIFKLTEVAAFFCNSNKTMGRVVDFNLERVKVGGINGRDWKTEYCAVIQFTDSYHKETKFESQMCESSDHLSVGDNIEVYYTPDSPENAKVNNFSKLWGFLIAFSVIPITFFALSFLYKKDEKQK